MPSASANVVGSGAGGREGITSRGSPMSSERARGGIGAGAAARGRWAPLEPGRGGRTARGGGGVTVLAAAQAASDAVAQDVFCRTRHRRARLAAPEHEDALGAGEVTGFALEGPVDEAANVAGRQRRVPDGARRLARRRERSFWSRSPASCRTSSVFGKQNRIFVRPSSGCA